VTADQTIAPDGPRTRQDYPVHLRHIRFHDTEKGKTLIFVTNQATLPASTICDLYQNAVDPFDSSIRKDGDTLRFLARPMDSNTHKTTVSRICSTFIRTPM
jgi:hypothetical protein